MSKASRLPEGMTKRGRVYWADFRADGRRIRKRLSTDLKTARQLLTELRARVERADYSLVDNDLPIVDLQAEYLKHCRQTKKPGTVDRYEDNLAAILPHMPPKVSGVTIQRVLAYRQQRLAVGISPGTVNMDVAVLGAMFNWGVKYQLIGSNPIKGLDRVPHDRPKEGRPLSGDEVDLLLEHSPQHYADLWYALLVTGMRIGELAAIRFRDVDWESQDIVVPAGVAKNHKARRLPVDGALWEMLLHKREGRTLEDRVFVNIEGGPLRRGPVRQGLMRCCKRAGIETRTLDADGHEVEHVDVHSLRRTFATDLIENGADPKTVQELMGHAKLEMTMKLYARIRTGTKRQAVGRLSYGRGVKKPDHLIDFPAG